MPSFLNRLLAAAVLCGVAALPLFSFGCASTAWEREQQRLTELDTAMRSAAERLNAADLPAALVELDAAEALARSEREAARVQSLRQVLAGAVALRDGDGAGAADAWSRIPSPTLRYEVQEKAAGVGIQVPDGPTGG